MEGKLKALRQFGAFTSKFISKVELQLNLYVVVQGDPQRVGGSLADIPCVFQRQQYTHILQLDLL